MRARACRRCRVSARSLAGGDLVELHTWGCDPHLPPDPDPDLVVAALHLEGAALLEVPTSSVVLNHVDTTAATAAFDRVTAIDLQDALRRQREDRTRQMLADGLIDDTGEPTTFVRPAGDGTGIVALGESTPAGWRPAVPLWDDLDLYRDDDVDPHTAAPRHAARRSAALEAGAWAQDASGRAWAVLCETGRFLRAFPVLAGALAEKWAAEAAAISDHEFARGYEAGRADARTETER